MLRRERRARRNRRLLGIALGAGIALSGTAAIAATLPPEATRAVAAPTYDAQAAAVAQATLDRAQDAIEDAHEEVDTSQLESEVEELSDYDEMPAVVIRGETLETEQLAQDVLAETAALEQEDAEAAAQAEEERAAAEAAAAANTPEGAQATAERLASETYGWGSDQFGCLVSLWNKESGWNYQASNASSGAYGIPQSLPGDKMATVADDWATNATTQVTWGLDYISRAYGTPCAAWAHSQSVNWY
ncbi:hypothetical protein K5S26_13210 [Microbacterium marinilacus]|nr:hypothetical protein [Microbacterium marinilacus]